MPRLSHYGPGKGFNVYLTEAEKKAIGTERVDATFHMKSDNEFIRLHPNQHGRYGITPQKNKHTPWRVQLAGQDALPPFGVENVEGRIVAGGSLSISKPKMGKEPMYRHDSASPIARIEKVIRKARKMPKAEHITLRDAIEAINTAWQELGGDLEISVDPASRKVTARHMVEY